MYISRAGEMFANMFIFLGSCYKAGFVVFRYSLVSCFATKTLLNLVIICQRELSVYY